MTEGRTSHGQVGLQIRLQCILFLGLLLSLCLCHWAQHARFPFPWFPPKTKTHKELIYVRLSWSLGELDGSLYCNSDWLALLVLKLPWHLPFSCARPLAFLQFFLRDCWAKWISWPIRDFIEAFAFLVKCFLDSVPPCPMSSLEKGMSVDHQDRALVSVRRHISWESTLKPY